MAAMNYPKISIIIPSFNQGLFLEQAIQSVIDQDYPNIELIVIDGGSQDSSTNIIDKYQSRIAYWVSEIDKGQSQAIDKGFQKCHGEIITFLSSDDYYLPGTFSDVALKYLENSNLGAVIGGFFKLSETDDQLSNLITPRLDGPSPTDLSLGPPGKYRLHQVSTFYSRKALETVGMYVREDMHYVMDRELLYRVCNHFPIVLSEKLYGVFRVHLESKSVSSILPFAKEFAQLYLDSCTGEPKLDRRRKMMARYRLSRGYLKYSQKVSDPSEVLKYLIKAGTTYPRIILTNAYLRRFSRLFKSKII